MNKTRNFVAVVDDNEENRYSAVRFLKKAGFDVVEGKTGGEALKIAGEQPLLILLDVRLPDMLGFDVCRQLKTNPLTAHIPILQTSASFTQTSDKAVGLEAGADAYLIAPYEPEELIATVRALIRIRDAEKNARSLAQQWQSTFDAIHDPICIVNESGRIERINAAFTKLFQRGAGPGLGLGFQEFARSGGVPENVYLEAMQSGKSQCTHYQSETRWYELRVDPLAVESGRPDAVVSWSDITAIKTASAKIEELNRELEQRIADRTADLAASVRELESFTYSIAHDLRAPLRAIEGFTGALLDTLKEPLSPEGANFAARIRAAAHHMDELTQDLLRYARLGKTSASSYPVDPLPLIKEASARAVEASGREVSLEFPAAIPQVLANETLLRQVVVNLVDNGIKYSFPGRKPCIVITAEARDGFVRVRFRDNGIGIDAAHFDRIFKVFERLHSQLDYSGTGIGLAIVRRSLELLGGHVGLESNPGEGSTFWIELPSA